MKKIVLFIIFTLCFLMLSGCGKTPQKPPDETKKPESMTQTEATALEKMQDRIADNKCMLGVGFIGYIDSESNEKAVITVYYAEHSESGCYDFTDYEMTDEELAQNASDFLTATDEVRDALERGMKLLYTGDIQVIGGRKCLLFALGTEHEEQFVREQLYAVSDDQIYAYSAVTDSWEPLGAG